MNQYVYKRDTYTGHNRKLFITLNCASDSCAVTTWFFDECDPAFAKSYTDKELAYEKWGDLHKHQDENGYALIETIEVEGLPSEDRKS